MTSEISLSGRNCYKSLKQPPCRCFETILVCEENEFDHRIFALLKQQLERPEFFMPFSLLVQQRKNAMIEFIHSTPYFKYKSSYYHQPYLFVLASFLLELH